jgi:hypothetical protein
MLDRNIPLDTEYDIGYPPMIQPLVESEEGVRHEAIAQLHNLVVMVLRILGIEGRFSLPASGNNHIVGEPDFSWLRIPTMYPKVVVRVSMIFVFDRPHLCGTDRVQDNMGCPS